MKRSFLAKVIACLSLCLAAISAFATPLRAFDDRSFAQLRAAHAGGPLLVHVWGMTCGPCLRELPQWARVAHEHPRVPVVLVQLDAVPWPVVEGTLRRDGLEPLENWAVTEEPDEFLRASIDPGWAGEMPYTLLISAHGEVTRLRGVVNQARLRDWLRSESRRGR